MFLKIEVQVQSEGGDFLNIFLRLLGFWDPFSYKKTCKEIERDRHAS